MTLRARGTVVAWLRALWPGLVALVVFVGLGVMSGSSVFDVWTREWPLSQPLQIRSVENGTVTLADGRVFRPAGVVRRETVSAHEFDGALRVITAQGAEVLRDVGDGSAFLLVEPKFYNWCGTAGYKGSPFHHWAGGYFPCSLSEFLVYAGYARPNPNQDSLTPRERWRMEGTEVFEGVQDPMRISMDSAALRWDPTVHHFAPGELDMFLEAIWKSPPAE